MRITILVLWRELRKAAGLLTLAVYVSHVSAQNVVVSGAGPQSAAPPAASPAPVKLSCAALESGIVSDDSISLYQLSIYADLCLGVEGDQDSFTVSVRKVYGNPASGQESGSALHIIVRQVMEHPGLYVPETARIEALKELEAASQAVDTLVVPGTGASSAEFWKVNNNDSTEKVKELHLSAWLTSACEPAVKTPKCDAALATAKDWLRLINLANGALTLYAHRTIEARRAESQRRLEMWTAYRDEALPQFQWEWALNSWYIGRHSHRERDSSGQPIGPLPLPTTELVFLHPGTAVEWRDGVKNGSKAQPAIYLEVAGIYRWSWNESTGAMQGARGISAIMTYSKRQDQTRVGYGLLFHWRKSAQFKPFSVAVTKAGGDTSFLVNVDLAEYVKDKLGYYQQAEANIDTLKDTILHPGEMPAKE